MKCHICHKDILRRIDPNKLKRNEHHFCSRECYVVFWAEERTGKKNYKWNNENERTCQICSNKFRASLNKGKLPKYCSIKCAAVGKIGTTKGDKNGMWKGGIAGINNEIRHSRKYKEWRSEVYRRDYWTCQFCRKHLKRLIAHHIKSFEKYPELRFKVDNGITLCRACHCKLHAENKGVHDFTNILNDYMPNISGNTIKI